METSSSDLIDVQDGQEGQEAQEIHEGKEEIDLLEIPPDILFPSELNQHLKDEVKYLVQENTMLKRNVLELEETVRNQTNQLPKDNHTKDVKEEEQSHEYFGANEITRAKIIELSKRLREKSAQVMHYKTKCAKLNQCLAVMKQREVEQAEADKLEEKPEKPEKLPESELKFFNDKISQLNAKLFEEKNHVHSLRSELKMAVKILQEEVGESYENVQQLSTSGRWKGRAQIIAELQYKLQEAKEKRREFEKNGQCATKKSFYDMKLIKLSKENDSLKGELTMSTRKLEQAKVKLKNADAECANWRTKYSSMAAQVERERTIVNTLAESNASSQTQLAETLKRRERQVDKLQKDNKELKTLVKSKDCDIDNLHKIIKEKDQILANKLSMRPNSPQINSHLSPGQMDADRLRLLELSKVYSQRLQRERDAKCSFEMLYKTERQRAAKLEANLARAKLEDSEKSSYCSLMSKPGFEENVVFKLELAQEKVKALQTRLEIEKSEREQDMHEFSV